MLINQEEEPVKLSIKQEEEPVKMYQRTPCIITTRLQAKNHETVERKYDTAESRNVNQLRNVLEMNYVMTKREGKYMRKDPIKIEILMAEFEAMLL